jgi:DMSO/TMAO reductase YedYZ molybdopterin-dependent catalytic subunit
MQAARMIGIDRRSLALGVGALLAGCSPKRTQPPASAAATAKLPFANGERPLAQYPQKRPLLRLTARPPQLETPFSVFKEGLITPNDAFFVRYHEAGLPVSLDPDAFRLAVGGHVERPQSLSLAQLRTDFAPVELVAVNQCSGNSRGFFQPRVPGGQLGNGAMGNAKWRGVRLKDVLDRAGVQSGAVQVSFRGLDTPVAAGTPPFVKALDIDHARSAEVMVAYAMNGADLPFLNGYPIRLVVPGYYGTYWVKHLSQIDVLTETFDGYWMKSAYRVPDNDCACTPPGEKPAATRPIGRLNIRSFITSHADGDQVPAGRPFDVRGIAFDGGDGVTQVLVSADDGRSWVPATLGESQGPYAFREWRIPLTLSAGTHPLKARAIGRTGETQPLEPRWNPSGYMRNVVETVTVRAV